MTRTWILMALLAALGGCSGTNFLDQRFAADRSAYGDKALPNPGTQPPPPHVQIINPDPSRPSVTEEVVTGTWTFTTPPTLTRVERRNGTLSQIALYNGRPAPTDTPIVVISVSRDARPIAAANPEKYHVQNTRSYMLNGNLAQEWTGQTDTGSGFSEIVLSRPGVKDEDVCHAVAIARTDAERKLALEILGSLTWTPTSPGLPAAAPVQGAGPTDSASPAAMPAANPSRGDNGTLAPAGPPNFQ
jgi:hypothetical protein